MSVFTTAGATLSENSVADEFHLNAAQLDKGVESGALQVKWRSMYGKLYRLFVRSEVSAYAKLVEPDQQLKAAHDARLLKQDLVSKRSRLDAVNAELSGIDAKKAALINEKQTLEQWLLTNDPKAAAQAAKATAKASKGTGKVTNTEKKRKLDT